MRPEDLIPAFADELERLGGRLPARLRSRMNLRGYYRSEAATFDLEGLFDSLDDLASPGCYFGASEGDGSDF